MKFKDAQRKAVEMFSSPLFIQRIKEEDNSMLKHLPILQEINAHGYLTIESQAGRKTSGKSRLDGKHYELSERAFVSGFMQEAKAVEFIKHMNTTTDKNAMFLTSCEDSLYLPSSLDIPVTITKKEGKTEINTHLSSALPQSVWDSWRKQIHLNKNEKIVFILCWDPLWNRNASGRNGLFKNILQVLKDV
jgi:hypothetical protein